MKLLVAVAVIGGISVLSASVTRAQDLPRSDENRGNAAQTIKGWPKVSQEVARAMMEKYGQPGGVTPDMLIWNNTGPWKRTIVYRVEIDHAFPMPHKDVLEQFIDYRIPPHKYDELAAYDGSVVVQRTVGEISARCDKEAANFLALNLAHDVVTGNKDVEQARSSYADSISAMMKGGKPANMQGLSFKVMQGGTGDPDRSVIQPAQK